MKKITISLTLFASLMLLLCSPLPAAASRLEEFVLYPFVQHFNWEEFDSQGGRILEESGPLFGVGTLLRIDLHEGLLMLQAKGELFGGNVDYEGQTQFDPDDPAVSEIPVNTDVDYFGTRIEGDFGLRLGGEAKGSIEPFVGLGYRYWIRDLNDSVAVDRNGDLVGVGGYTEEWQSLYTRWGMRGAYAFDEDFKLFAEVGGKYPLYNENRVDYFSENDVTIKPGEQFSSFAEAGFRLDRFRATVFYEGFKFKRSPLVHAGGGDFLLQPESKSEIIGISLGYCFQ